MSWLFHRERSKRFELSDDARGTFCALDFETAANQRDSACSVAVVRVTDGLLVRRSSWLIRPPRNEFTNTRVHGLTWDDVAGAPDFAAVWPEMKLMFKGAAFIAAHNAAFDRSVLTATAATAGVKLPAIHWVCTVEVARRVWDFPKNDLATVSRKLRLRLDHHDALSDAEACARIVLAALEG
jgi:DNA polymerase-3 subunit epsilon